MDKQKPCPYCAEPIKVEAIKCRHCGSMLPGAPPVPNPKDEEHLKQLQIAHTVAAAILGLFSCLPLLHVAVGILMIVSPDSMFKEAGGKGPPPAFGWLFAIMGGVFVLGGWTLSALIFAAGRAIGRRRRHLFCVIVAALSCLMMPFGTVLGVFSLIVLNRPSVKELFGEKKPLESL